MPERRHPGPVAAELEHQRVAFGAEAGHRWGGRLAKGRDAAGVAPPAGVVAAAGVDVEHEAPAGALAEAVQRDDHHLAPLHPQRHLALKAVVVVVAAERWGVAGVVVQGQHGVEHAALGVEGVGVGFGGHPIEDHVFAGAGPVAPAGVALFIAVGVIVGGAEGVAGAHRFADRAAQEQVGAAEIVGRAVVGLGFGLRIDRGRAGRRVEQRAGVGLEGGGHREIAAADQGEGEGEAGGGARWAREGHGSSDG